MRIVSLVPHATELLFELGLGDQVVGVTHECDYPEEARTRRHVTRDRLPAGLDAGQIDAAVRSFTERGEAIYDLDEDVLKDLKPDLIVTQALCPVCAVSAEDVEAIAATMDPIPPVLSLDPTTYGETIGDVKTVAKATGSEIAALGLIARAAKRVDAISRALGDEPRRPRVAAIEWFDPLMTAGHWTPQLIEMAGGEDVLGFAGEHSEQTTWEIVAAAKPDVVIAMPCGYDAERSHEEALRFADELRTIGAGEVVAVDASAYFSRPGPRLVDCLELLAHILHPELVPSAPGEALPVDL
jgi:iron complex transport system substrate-binding protein